MVSGDKTCEKLKIYYLKAHEKKQARIWVLFLCAILFEATLAFRKIFVYLSGVQFKSLTRWDETSTGLLNINNKINVLRFFFALPAFIYPCVIALFLKKRPSLSVLTKRELVETKLTSDKRSARVNEIGYCSLLRYPLQTRTDRQAVVVMSEQYPLHFWPR